MCWILQGQLAECFRLFEKGEGEIVIQGLGAAVPRAVNLALQVEHNSSGLAVLHPHTFTVHLVGKAFVTIIPSENDHRNK